MWRRQLVTVCASSSGISCSHQTRAAGDAAAQRDVPISRALAERLSARGAAHDELVFRSTAGSILDPDNLATRALAPACAAAEVRAGRVPHVPPPLSSRLFAEGRNVVQVQRWLGHHSASFTRDTYVHLLDNHLGEPLQAAAPLGVGLVSPTSTGVSVAAGTLGA
jgi:integrase